MTDLLMILAGIALILLTMAMSGDLSRAPEPLEPFVAEPFDDSDWF